MTVYVYIGRRIPRRWYSRLGSKVKGLITFQEHMWQIITSSLNKAKRKANNDKRLLFNISRDTEQEDLHYQIEWRIVTIQGPKEMEKEEYEESMKMYDALKKSFKKDFDTDENFSKQLKSKKLPESKIREAYDKGYGVMEDNNIANKLLEMGIMTYIEWEQDFEIRDDSNIPLQ